MKIIVRLAALVCIAGLAILCAHGAPFASAAGSSSPADTSKTEAAPAGEVSAARIADGQAIADHFLKREYEAVEARFDATMKSAFPLDKMKEARESLEARLGAFKGQLGTRAEKYQQYDIVYVTWEFEQMTIDFRMAFNASGEIAGLLFQPAQSATPYVPPAYVKTDAFREQDVTVGSGEWALPGTLALPVGNGPFPAVVLVHGSGPHDRDETVGPNRPFRDLAWGLASRGIAVLRYEKRTKAHSVKFTAEMVAKLTVKEETIDDALSAVSLLRETKGIDPARIYVLGHSLGAMVLPRIASADPRIAGLIVMAGPTRPLEDVILDQVNYINGLDGTVSDTEKASMDSLKVQAARAKDPALSSATPAESLPLGLPAAYWIDLRGYEPAEAAKALKQPMLVLQGGRDYQVTSTDFEGWRAALGSRPDVVLKLYPNLNHLFAEGDGMGTPAEYGREGHVAEPVITDIAGWIVKPAGR